MAYDYHAGGSLKAQTLPSGRVLEFAYDLAARPTEVRGTDTDAPYYVHVNSYAANGAIAQATLGNGLVQQTEFDADMMWPATIKLGTTAGATDHLQLGYTYTSAGNVETHSIGRPTSGGTFSASQSFGYDSLNRLTTSSEGSGNTWSRTHAYDRYGNMRVSANSGVPLSSLTRTAESDYEATTNRFVKPQNDPDWYDAAGNLIRNPVGETFEFDAENKMTEANLLGSITANYEYDGEGRRVRKTIGTTTTVYVYDAAGQMVAEYTNTETGAETGTRYITADHLGSTRLVTDQGQVQKECRDYLPFGEEIESLGGRNAIACYTAAASVSQKFTGKERDGESALDYFGARYFAGGTGRFASPDPSGLSVELDDPQTWNRYSYVGNSPLGFVDPNGKFKIPTHVRMGVQALEAAGFPNAEAFTRSVTRVVDIGFFFNDTFHAMNKDRYDATRDELLSIAADPTFPSGSAGRAAVALVAGMHLVQDRFAHIGIHSLAGHWRAYGFGDADDNQLAVEGAQIATNHFVSDVKALLVKRLGQDGAQQAWLKIQSAAARMSSRAVKQYMNEIATHLERLHTRQVIHLGRENRRRFFRSDFLLQEQLSLCLSGNPAACP